MPAKVFAVIAYLIGIGGAALFYAYIVGTGISVWPRNEEVNGALSRQINFGLFILFAVQHTGMARQAWKRRLGPLARSVYVAASGITAGLLAIFWQAIPGEPIWHGPTWIVAIGLLGASVIGYCGASFDHGSFFGLTQAWTGQPEIRGPLYIKGPYRYIRHPLMLCFLIAIWGQPIMPWELLMLNAWLTIYVFAGIQFEEQDLVNEFGAEYEEYRRRVPMLIPWKWW